jgi:2-amino-4-hydroxy-6-hydroxymethyldihydropteridine diphosphokinase
LEELIYHSVYISIGSNLGDREKNIEKALAFIESEIGRLVKCAAFIETEPVDMDCSDFFLNTCIEIQTYFEPFAVLDKLKKIEIKMGRDPLSKGLNQSRIIDLDIIFFGGHIVDSKELTIPHKNFRTRNFVLVPLIELNPFLTDPKTKLTVQQLIN